MNPKKKWGYFLISNQIEFLDKKVIKDKKEIICEWKE